MAQPGDGRPIEDAIALFEGILQTSPDDQVALEALSLAYEQTGNPPLARATLLRLAQVIIRKNAQDAAPAVIERLRPLIENDFDALEALRSLEVLAADREPGTQPAVSTPAPAPKRRSGVALRRQLLRREMDLAWKLLEAQELTQEEYATLVEDLSRLVTDERQATVSLLHALADRGFQGLDRVMRYLARTSKVPFLALESFDLQPFTSARVSLDDFLRQGALPFGEIGGEWLVALLSPLDRELRQELSDQLGGRCHFYLVTPEAFDAAAKKIVADAAPATEAPEA